MTGITEAMAEAYVSAPHEEIIFHTIEIRHPSFLDDDGNPTAIRLVQENEDLVAALESDAPLNPGQWVTFTACPFDFKLPKVEEGSAPGIELTIGNVTRFITPYLEGSVSQLNPIEATYRPYLLSDLSRPQMDPVLTMSITKVSVDAFSVSGKATGDELVNFPFPNDRYTTDRFKNLT